MQNPAVMLTWELYLLCLLYILMALLGWGIPTSRLVGDLLGRGLPVNNPAGWCATKRHAEGGSPAPVAFQCHMQWLLTDVGLTEGGDRNSAHINAVVGTVDPVMPLAKICVVVLNKRMR